MSLEQIHPYCISIKVWILFQKASSSIVRMLSQPVWLKKFWPLWIYIYTDWTHNRACFKSLYKVLVFHVSNMLPFKNKFFLISFFSMEKSPLKRILELRTTISLILCGNCTCFMCLMLNKIIYSSIFDCIHSYLMILFVLFFYICCF